MERKTPLYDVHVAEGGKMVPFAGYLLPVQYGTGVIQEHMAVRQQAGLFDVSHMGEILFTGPTALDTLNHLLTNDYSGMPVNKVRYGVMCNAQGGTIDDLVVYKFGEEAYLAVVNASNREKDYAHMAQNLLPGTKAEDISDTVAQLALQGPKAPAILKSLLPEDQIPKGYYTALPRVEIQGIPCMISRTGYTGELGYEIYTANEDAPKLWKILREAGESFSDVESVKAVSDVFSPVTGTVTAVNEALLDDPAQVNEAPYEAWLIKVSQVSDTEELLDAEGYEAVVAAEEA